MELSEHERASQERYEDLKQTIMESKMPETNQFFQNPMAGQNTGWGAALGAGAGAIVGELLGIGNRNNGNGGGAAPAAPAVTPDQLQTALGNLQGQIQRDQLQTQIGDLAANVAGVKAGVDSAVAGAVGQLGGAIGGVKDAVVAGNQSTAMSLCQLGNAMQQGFGALNNTVVAEAAATRARIDQLEIGNLRDKIAERDLKIAEIQDQARHRETQIVVSQNVNAAANANAVNVGTNAGCVNQLSQALQLATLLRQNQCCPASGSTPGTTG